MSGGSHGYIYISIEEFGRAMLKCEEPYRKAFGRHLLDVAEAAHDVEWVDSGDMSGDADKEAIMKCISDRDIGREMIVDAEKILENLQAWIYEAKGG